MREGEGEGKEKYKEDRQRERGGRYRFGVEREEGWIVFRVE